MEGDIRDGIDDNSSHSLCVILTYEMTQGSYPTETLRTINILYPSL